MAKNPPDNSEQAGESGQSQGGNRRTFLKMGLFGSAGVALGLPVVRVGLWWNREPGKDLQSLSTREFELVEAMAEAWFPPGGDPPESGKEMNLAMFVDAQIAGMNNDIARVLKAGLHALQDLTLIEEWTTTPFHRLPLEERQRILTDWEVNPSFPKRSLIRLYKWYIGMGFCEYPGMLERVGVDYRCE
ncbi:MAG: hypothetical protein KC561_02255 [Myxococcales bacterium]|nr:hypothetical protein [Myxococcales bacterium]